MDPATPLNTAHEERGVWLLKIPRFLADSWMSRRSGSQLGRVELSGAGDEHKARLILDEDVASEDRPSTFDLSFIPNPPHLVVFSESDQGDFALEGTVCEKADARPVATASYREIMRKRSLPTFEHVSVGMDLREEKRRRNAALRPTIRHAPAKPSGQQWEVRARTEEGPLRERLFTLFGRRPRWTYKELQKDLEQPDVWMREILQKYGVYTREGPNRGTWELKEVYRGSEEERDEGV